MTQSDNAIRAVLEEFGALPFTQNSGAMASAILHYRAQLAARVRAIVRSEGAQ